MMTKVTNGQPEESLKEALHRWASRSDLKFKRQAELLNIRESTFANSLNPHIEDCHYHLRYLVPHTLLLSDCGMLDYLEACVGRVAFAIPKGPACVADLQAELARTIKEFGDVVQASGEALEDGCLSRDEVVRIEREVHDLVRQAMGFLRSVKERVERA